MSAVRDLSLVVSGLLFLQIVQDYFTQSNAIKTIDNPLSSNLRQISSTTALAFVFSRFGLCIFISL